MKYFSYKDGICKCHHCNHQWNANRLLRKSMENRNEEIVECPSCGQYAVMKNDGDDWEAMLEDEMDMLIEESM
jgi:NAD-dependent SIR2 family protein deacetylase